MNENQTMQVEVINTTSLPEILKAEIDKPLLMFVSQITQNYSCKNRLQSSLAEQMKSFDRTLVEDADLPAFKEKINALIKKYNAMFHKCQPIVPVWWENEDYVSVYVQEDHFLSLPMLRMTLVQAPNKFSK